jgi:hypothetical protein
MRLDRIDWSDRPSGAPRPVNRASIATEEDVLRLRGELAKSDLGDSGADAIREAMIAQQIAPIPSRRTIGRILQRRGILDGRQRTRRPPPPIGWYLPQVASSSSELDSFDTIEGLAFRGKTVFGVLTGISVHGGVTSCWPRQSITAAVVVELLIARWREFGLPDYAQFDNALIFLGPRQYPDAVGQVIRTCLLLGVMPVFAPPREPGFQNAVESLNGRWQAKVWERFEHASLQDLELPSGRWLAATALRYAARSERALGTSCSICKLIPPACSSSSVAPTIKDSLICSGVFFSSIQPGLIASSVPRSTSFIIASVSLPFVAASHQINLSSPSFPTHSHTAGLHSRPN